MARVAGDKLSVRKSGADVPILTSWNTLSGVEIVLVGGLNGLGRGVLYYDGSGNLSWQAPGSSTAGAEVDVSAGGSFVVYDGENLDKWLEVSVTAGSLPGGMRAVGHSVPSASTSDRPSTWSLVLP